MKIIASELKSLIENELRCYVLDFTGNTPPTLVVNYRKLFRSRHITIMFSESSIGLYELFKQNYAATTLEYTNPSMVDDLVNYLVACGVRRRRRWWAFLNFLFTDCEKDTVERITEANRNKRKSRYS